MGGRGRRGGGESSGHATSSNNERISRKLTQLLRHRIHENGLGSVLRSDGYVPLDAVLALQQFDGIDVVEIRRVVATNDKQRLSLSEQPDGTLMIRANQGHTSTGIDPDALLVRLDEVAAAALAGGSGRAVHGTYLNTWPAIVASGGLHHMSRHHVHLAEGLPGDSGVVSGMRRSAQVHIWVDVVRATRAGIPFYRSQNSVILSPGNSEGYVPIDYFARVEDAAGREWRDGEWRPSPAATDASPTPSSAQDSDPVSPSKKRALS